MDGHILKATHEVPGTFSQDMTRSHYVESADDREQGWRRKLVEEIRKLGDRPDSQRVVGEIHKLGDRPDTERLIQDIGKLGDRPDTERLIEEIDKLSD